MSSKVPKQREKLFGFGASTSSISGNDCTHQATQIYPVTLMQNGAALLHFVQASGLPSGGLSAVLHETFYIEPIKEASKPFSKRHERVVCIGTVLPIVLASTHITYLRNGYGLPVHVIGDLEYDPDLTDAFRSQRRQVMWPCIGYANMKSVEAAIADGTTLVTLVIKWF